MRLTVLLPLCVPILSLPYPADSACPSSASACPLLPEEKRDEQAPVTWPESVPLGPLLDSVREGREAEQAGDREGDRELAWMIT